MSKKKLFDFSPFKEVDSMLTDVEILRKENDKLRVKLDFLQQREAYMNDPMFHTVVDMLFDMLMTENISVLELRAAATFASNKYWEKSVQEEQYYIRTG